jgi:hypothetical protein
MPSPPQKNCLDETHAIRLRYEILLALVGLLAAGIYHVAKIEQQIYSDRVYSRAVCNELTRLTKELNRIPVNDCDRP